MTETLRVIRGPWPKTLRRQERFSLLKGTFEYTCPGKRGLVSSKNQRESWVGEGHGIVG